MTIHKTLIAQILDTIPGTATHGFRQKCIDAIKITEADVWDADREADVRSDLRFVPDAYSIDKAGQAITIYEVEVGHHLDDSKLNALANAWIYLDCIEWNLRLIVVNRFGTHSEVNLGDEYQRRVDERYMPKPPAQPDPPAAIPAAKPTKRVPRGSKVFWWENDSH